MNNQDSEKYETLYRELLKYSEETHERNKKRISAGIKCLIIIPVLLLILLFNVTSNKIAFLIIWIMSVLIITGALIAIEYKDHMLQKKIRQLSGQDEEIRALTAEQMEEVRRRTKHIPKSSSDFFKIFTHDMKKIFSNVVAIVIMIGLICLPCIYCWTNLLSSWSPYTDLNALNIGVYSMDQGFYVGDVYINIGQTVMESLKENDTVGWVFYGEGADVTDKDTREKLDDEIQNDVYKGDLYAAFVIPEDFSEKLIDFMNEDLAHPTIQYYENQKKNAIVPKITSKVKTTVQGQVNDTIITQLSTVIAEAGGYFTGDDKNITAAGTTTLENLSSDLNSYINILNSFIYITQSAQTIMSSSHDLIPDLDSIVKNGQNTINSMENILVSGNQTISQAGATMDAAFDLVDSQLRKLEELAAQDTNTIESALGTIQSDVTLIRNQMKLLETMLESWKNMTRDNLNGTTLPDNIEKPTLPDNIEKPTLPDNIEKPTLPDNIEKPTLPDNIEKPTLPDNVEKPTLPDSDAVKNQVEEQKKKLEEYYNSLEGNLTALQNDLTDLENLAGTSQNDSKALRKELLAKLQNCEDDFKQVKQVYNSSLKQSINSTGNSLYTSLIKASGLLTNMNVDFDSISQNLQKYADELQNGTIALTDSKTMAENLVAKLNEITSYLNELQQNEQYQALADLLENHPEQFADFVAEPTKVHQNVIYEINDKAGNSYASSMSAFYTVLALYLSSLFCMVIIHAEFNHKNYPEISGKVSRFQQYIGRWMTFACVSIPTSVILALGDLLFIEVQCKHPVAFVLSVVAIGLVFNLFAYSCAFGLGLIGEAFALLCMIIAVACSSSFPFDLLPDIFTKLNNLNLIIFQPGMNMLKETIAGYNAIDYWNYFLQLMGYVFAGALIALGISRIPPVHWICELFEKRKNDSHVML